MQNNFNNLNFYNNIIKDKFFEKSISVQTHPLKNDSIIIGFKQHFITSMQKIKPGGMSPIGLLPFLKEYINKMPNIIE